MPKTTLRGASYEEDRVPEDVKAEAEQAKATEDAGKGDEPARTPRKRAPRKRTQSTGQD